MKVISLAWLLLLVALFSCKKDKEETPDRRALLTARAWRLDQALLSGVPVTDPQLLSAIGSFNQSRLQFNSDGTFTSTNTATNTVSRGTWQFSNGEQGLKVTIDNQNYDFTIKALTAGQLILTTPFTIPPIPTPLEAELRLVPA